LMVVGIGEGVGMGVGVGLGGGAMLIEYCALACLGGEPESTTRTITSKVPYAVGTPVIREPLPIASPAGRDEPAAGNQVQKYPGVPPEATSWKPS
jgi:hypothetical protein